MDKKYCSHCGNEIEENAGSCSVCNAPTHFHGKDWQSKAPKKFIIYFIGLVIFCFLVMYIAPRDSVYITHSKQPEGASSIPPTQLIKSE